MRPAVAVLLAGFAAACASSGQVSVAPSEAEQVQICKRVQTIDSNLPQRVCATQSQWDAYDKQGQENVEEFERRRDELASPDPL